jgi:hypothetical protein
MGVFKRLTSKKAKKAKPAPAPERTGSDSDDLSLMTDSDLEEERATLRAALNAPRLSNEALVAAARDPFEQASLWAEVRTQPPPTM